MAAIKQPVNGRIKMKHYIMQLGTTVTGRRGWMVLLEMPSLAAAKLYLKQNAGDNLKIESI